MKWFLLFLAATSFSFATESTRAEYLSLIQQHPALVTPIGNSSAGEIEILVDPTVMAAIEKKTGRDIGLVKRDPFLAYALLLYEIGKPS
jgi:hypothetical protein